MGIQLGFDPWILLPRLTPSIFFSLFSKPSDLVLHRSSVQIPTTITLYPPFLHTHDVKNTRMTYNIASHRHRLFNNYPCLYPHKKKKKTIKHFNINLFKAWDHKKKKQKSKCLGRPHEIVNYNKKQNLLKWSSLNYIATRFDLYLSTRLILINSFYW